MPQFLTGSRVVAEDVEISFAAVVSGDEADSPERMVRSKDDTLRNVRALLIVRIRFPLESSRSMRLSVATVKSDLCVLGGYSN